MMTNKKNILSAINVSLVLVLILSTSCRSPEEDIQKDLRISVLLAPVEQRELAEPLRTFGRLAAPREIKLSFKIGGIIEEILVSEGQRVQKGQVLARLNLSEIGSQVQQARSVFDKAQRDFKRVDNLYQEKAATLEQHQNVQTALQVAQAQLDMAEFNLRYAEIRAPSGALANIDIGGINLDEPLGGTKALDFDTFVFTEKGTYQIKICIPLAVDDLPGNNCKTVDVEIIDPGVLIDDLIDYFETFEPDDPPYGWYNHPHNCLTQAKGKIVSYLSIIPPGPESLKNNAIRKLGDFIDDVDALLADGLISYDEWYELTTAANQIIWLLSNCY